MNEKELVRLLSEMANGSKQAFDQFYETTISFVYQIALSIVHNHAEAEDICHDVFLEVYGKAKQYSEDRGSVKAWLAVRTRSRSLDRLRRNKWLLTDRLEELVDKKGKVPATELYFLQSIEKHILIDALKEIPENQRQAIIRSYFHDETHGEIALKMNKPLGSVKSFIRYGINNLQKQKSLVQWVMGGSRGEKNE
ncbi:RNA polymerase sigma-70 factor (ECF subfamily) [Gracilibacillus halotolerans]|uniref:RNA polymerase sigma-70 factor (ECF subfamily) n=1 Tax=Gracilibacillus halotolerans TaxID=74386 RepID=A0A841RMZ8_9BACI|nr:RNA polymerase sigma factor [Gracilibacillus halotolerans]MBB6512058.1 RNA polymerase sigma-70 factor (ECF subfamily) [Gracilibacillus halotolerans]